MRRLLPALATLLCCMLIPAHAADPYPQTGNFGVPFSEDEDWYRQCMRVEGRAAPPTTAAAPPDCDAGALYYRKRAQAFTSQAEWDQVRACAIEHGDDTVLMMLYANGFGVARDRDVAIHHACKLPFIAKSEMSGRVAHLAEVPDFGKVFDQCDDITSGYMMGVCAGIKARQDGHVRDGRLQRMAATLPAPARSALARLRAAAERYAGAAAAETDMQGSAAPSFVFQRQDKVREEFMQAALDAADGKLAAASSQDAAARDRELNAVYQQLMAAPSPQDGWPDRLGRSTIERKDVRKAERAWIVYRDAFAAFAAQLRPAPGRDAVGALLTGQRIAALKDVARYL